LTGIKISLEKNMNLALLLEINLQEMIELSCQMANCR